MLCADNDEDILNNTQPNLPYVVGAVKTRVYHGGRGLELWTSVPWEVYVV